MADSGRNAHRRHRLRSRHALTLAPLLAFVAALLLIAKRTIEALRQHRVWQAAEQLAAEDWADSGLVFTEPDGQWLRPDRVYVTLRRLVEQAGVPSIGVHGLRHTMASLALQNGTDIATVSQRLDHSDTSVTTKVYLHGSEETDRAAAEVLERVVGE